MKFCILDSLKFTQMHLRFRLINNMNKMNCISICLCALLYICYLQKSAAQISSTTENYELIINYQFELGVSFSEGLAGVVKKGKWGFIDKTGSIVIDYQFDYCLPFSEGLAPVKRGNRWGFINKTGSMVIDFQYKKATPFYDSVAAVKKGAFYHYINTTGNKVISSLFTKAGYFSEGLAPVAKSDKLGYIDKLGKTMVFFKFDGAGSFSQGLAPVKNDRRWGYIDKDGNTEIDFLFQNANSFSEGLAAVRKGDKWGFIDKTENAVIDFQFISASSFSGGLAPVSNDGRWGYIDKTGHTIIDFQFDYAERFSDGMALVKKDGKYGYIRGLNIEEQIKEYVIQEVNEWQNKGKYESTEEYQKRVTQENRERIIANFTIKGTNIIASKNVDLSNLITEYDPDNEVFKISTSGMSPFYVKVPRSEAEEFDKNLKELSFQNKIFALGVNGNYVLTEAFIKNPANGKSYSIDKEQTLAFGIAKLEMNFEPIEFSVSKIETQEREVKTTAVKVGVSDVDTNIPSTDFQNENAFALIIGNEKYSNEISVPYAVNDATTFKKYVQKTLGVPEKHIHFLSNATYGQMLGEIDWLTNVIEAYQGKATVYFYYAGHGMPDAESKSSYLLPVDGYSGNQYTSIKLEDIYAGLTKNPTESVNVFLDACFSGSSRSGMLTTGRGVKIKPKEETIKGNMIVLSASSGEETAHPYNEKSHGLFTYFLLKKLQETKGNTTWLELSDYVRQNVSRISVVNNKSQTPSIIVSSELESSWEERTIK